jgi:hypothetical protein
VRPPNELLERKPAKCDNSAQGILAMKSRQGHKGYVIEARPYELRYGGFSADFSVSEASGMTETLFYVRYVPVAGIGDCCRDSGRASED